MTEKPLSGLQLRTIGFLIASRTNGEALSAAGISRQTLSRWRSDKAFCAELRRQQITAADEVVGRLHSAMSRAMDGLLCLLDTEDNHLRRLVANDILRQGFRALEMDSIQQRLCRLEEALEANRREVYDG